MSRPPIHRAWITRPLALAIALGSVIVGATPAHAASANSQPVKRIPDSTEQLISDAAMRALAALNVFVNNGDRDAFDLYRVFADRLAVPVAVALDLNASELQRSWAKANLPRQRAIIAGLTQLGVPYRLFTSIPFKGFDCSGLTSYAWGIAGVGIARGSRAQFYGATPIKAEQAQLGDLVWRPGHVAMYLGVPGAVLQAPTEGRSVEIQLMNERIAGWVRYANPLA
ncbi:MAG: C40 family peptidase [Actinomycetota bacterium]